MSAESTEHAISAEFDEDRDDALSAADDSSQGADAGTGKSVSASRLEEEGDVAADYLEELLDIADIDGDIDIEVRNGRTYISMECVPRSDVR